MAMDKSLFQTVPQSHGPIAKGETTFEFLQRGGRPEAIKIRQWIENWFREYPVVPGKEMNTRLKSKRFAEFMSGYFELQVFSALRRLGCDVEIHPNFSETATTVDFGVKHDTDRFYLEATVCGTGQGVLQSNANEEDAVRKIRDEIPCPHSDVWIDFEGKLLCTLGRRWLVCTVQRLLDSCSADAVFGIHDVEPGQRPQKTMRVENCKLHISLTRPLAADGRGRVRGPSRGGSVDGARSIENALRKKVMDWSRKKRDDAQFIIAINVCHSDYWADDELRAIYGSSESAVRRDSVSPFLASVSGVIVFGNATLGREEVAPVRLYENPGRCVPQCLRFLQQRTTTGELIGFAYTNRNSCKPI